MIGGVSGYLRQEFRELEILDEITKLQYEGTLAPQVSGITRNALIHSYRTFKGPNYVPSKVHSSIKWSDSNPFVLTEPDTLPEWKIIEKPKKSQKTAEPSDLEISEFPIKENSDLPEALIVAAKYVPAKGTAVLPTVSHDPGARRVPKRKLEDNNITQAVKKVRHDVMAFSVLSFEPKGFKWNADTFSCAYDSLMTLLLAVYSEHRQTWNEHIAVQNVYMQKFSDLVTEALLHSRSLENVRDEVR